MRTKTVLSKKNITLIATLVAAITTYFYRQPVQELIQSAPQAAASDYTVTRVSDGDTIQVKMGDKTETIRLIGVDTPETKDPRKAVQCFGKQASEFTKQQLLGKQVRLESDPNDSDRDKYKRLLRYVYIGETLHNAELVTQGYGFAYTVFPFTKLEQFRQLEAEARSTNRGLWAGCNINESTRIKQTNSTK
jgi:micrococcal nuclease